MNYREIYNNFIDKLSENPKSGAEVGEAICRMVQCFSDLNETLALKERSLNLKAETICGMNDENGKPLAINRADIITKATSEYDEYNVARKNLQNCEQYINALKCLQKGSLNEYSHMGNT